jgi:hypothetical protein
MDCSFMLWLFAVSVVASAFGGLLGMASGIFIVPILTMFGHIEIHKAIGASIVSVIACSCGGAAPFLENGMTNVRLAIVLENSHHHGRSDRGIDGRDNAQLISLFSIHRDPISFGAADVSEAS